MSDALHERLEYFAAAALTGLMANPMTLDQSYQKQMRAQNMTTEKSALLTAAAMIEILEKYKDALDKKKTVLVDASNLNP